MPEATSFCRLCLGLCGVKLSLDDAGRITQIRGDQDHATTLGYACFRGLNVDTDNQSVRLLHPLKRKPDGSFERIELETALDEVAERIRVILDRDGPDALGLFRGTYNYIHTTLFHMLPAWIDSIGTKSVYSTLTIDKSAHYVAQQRIGKWAAGYPNFLDADCWVFAGGNPLVAVSIQMNCVPCNPAKRIRDAKARGMKIIVIDPRATEIARHADIHLQLRPGEDVALASALIHIILREGWEDQEFCARHVGYVEELRAAVAPFTPEYAARRTGVSAKDLYAAAEEFGRISKNGVVNAGTGPNMSPRSNLTVHLYETLNVICGRFLRAGDRVWNIGPLGPYMPAHAQVVPPGRPWESGAKTRVNGYGQFYVEFPGGGEFPSGALAEEILTPGEGQIRGMLVAGGNPVVALPDKKKAIEALKSLELLVTTDPYLTETAQLADYIFPPLTQYEYPDITFSMPGIDRYMEPFAQYTPAIATPPEDSELFDDWYFYWAIAKRLGKQLVYGVGPNPVPLDMENAPTSGELIEIAVRHSRIPLDELKTHPSGILYETDQIVEPARPEATDKFEVAPPDVVAELREVANEAFVPGVTVSNDETFSHRLTNRRIRHVMNTSFAFIPSIAKKFPKKLVYIHPGDMAGKDLKAGDLIDVVSDHGRIPATVKPDQTMRPGVVSMSLDSMTNALVSSERDVEPINAMARMSGIPVNLVADGSGG